MTTKEILREVNTIIDNQMVDSLIFYFYEHREEKEVWAQMFKMAFNSKVATILEEMED